MRGDPERVANKPKNKTVISATILSNTTKRKTQTSGEPKETCKLVSCVTKPDAGRESLTKRGIAGEENVVGVVTDLEETINMSVNESI